MRREAIRRLEAWYFAWEAAVATPQHPLVAIEELHLPGTKATGYHIKETRLRRSYPPIRDMGREAEKTHVIMQHIKHINRKYFDTMVLRVELGSMNSVVKVMRVSRPTALRHFDSGIAALEMAIICGL